MTTDSESEAYDTATERALREVYGAVWGGRDDRERFYKEVAVAVPALSADGGFNEYTARFLHVASNDFFTQLVRAEHHVVLAAIDDALARLAPSDPCVGSSIIFGQTGVGKSTSLRLALIERLLESRQTMYLDDAARVLAVYTASGCRVFHLVKPNDSVQDIQSGEVWKTLYEWSAKNPHDAVAADFRRFKLQETATLVDSDPARPHPPYWLVAPGNAWVNAQATSTPPLDYVMNTAWAFEHKADRIWMDAWSWPEVYAACSYLYKFDPERLERARQVFFYATPTLEHCVEFSQSQSTVDHIRASVRALTRSFVASPGNLPLTRALLDLPVERPRYEGMPPVDRASVGTCSVHATWLYGVLEPDQKYDHRGRTSSGSFKAHRVPRPYIMFPRPSEGGAKGLPMRREARLRPAGDDACKVLRAVVEKSNIDVQVDHSQHGILLGIHSLFAALSETIGQLFRHIVNSS